MRSKNKVVGILVAAAMLMSIGVLNAQNSSINAFSPYTFYGLGDFATQGPASLRSMGGASTGFRSAREINYTNPASYSAVGRSTFLFDFALEGTSVYSKTSTSKSSFNTFNVRDVSLLMPLGKNIGFSVSVNPLTNVGYRVDMKEMDPFILANVGSVRYKYNGSGGVTQGKAGIGAVLFKNFSVGANLIYYHGSINRNFDTDIEDVMGSGTYVSVYGVARESISKISADFGVQYNIKDDDKQIFTIGATFRPEANLKPDVKRQITTSGIFSDSVSLSSYKKDFKLPMSFSVGLFYQNGKLGAGLDYAFEKWDNLNPADNVNGISFANNHFIKAGIQYTPNRSDVRRFYNRWTYRAGVRYNNYYMVVNGEKINDKALTFGVGIPIRNGMSNLNLGMEVGARGNTATGTYGTKEFQMIKERYVKFSIGFNLFGEDYWFVKHKYD